MKLAIKHNGAALIFFVFLIGLVATGIAIKSLSTSNLLKVSRDDKAAKTLADAKSALIGYTLSRVGAGERPGNMPNPDRLLTPNETPPVGGPPNYDGEPDSCTGTGASMICLGRLPWKAIGMAVPTPTQSDPIGIMPWYAVSANLIDPTCMSVMNPSVLNMTDNGTYPCGSSTLLPHPWLTVRDARGNVLSNRVAIVLMLSGATINGQSRPSAPLNGATSYLDSVTIPATCTAPCVPGNYSNADTDNDFIMAAGIIGATADANDRLLYITIDELMEKLTQRAAGELRTDLNAYRTANSRFPSAAAQAAPLGTNNYVAGGGDSGTAPIDVTDTITCNYAGVDTATCTVAFSLVGRVDLQRTTGVNQWDANSGSCSRVTISATNDTCRCTGAGDCSTTLSSFICNVAGKCDMSLFSGSTGRYIYTPPTYGSFPSTAMTGSCSASGVNARCDGDGTFGIRGILTTPIWFRANLWQDYFYYHKRTAADLQVGARTGIQALVIGTGSPIVVTPFAASKGSAQTRPSVLINNYLDSTENTDADLVFDATTTPHSASYNDQSFIIAP
jgi:hypothetical protein